MWKIFFSMKIDISSWRVVKSSIDKVGGEREQSEQGVRTGVLKSQRTEWWRRQEELRQNTGQLLVKHGS